MITKYKQFLGAFILILAAANVVAQKLPDKQTTSIWASANSKITSWDNKFLAYNNGSRIWYTIENDDNNLYLIIKAKSLYVNEKILRGGIAFTVRSSINKTNKSLKDDVGITFPVSENKKDLLTILRGSEIYRKLRNDTIGNRKEIDSLQVVLGKMSTSFFKQIKVTGIKGITDTLISVYNTSGIKATAIFSNKIEYTYGLIIPLKLLAASVNNGEKFSYNIRIESPPDSEADTIIAPPIPEMMSGKIYISGDPNEVYRFSPTDFWGEYTLAKKPS